MGGAARLVLLLITFLVSFSISSIAIFSAFDVFAQKQVVKTKTRFLSGVSQNSYDQEVSQPVIIQSSVQGKDGRAIIVDKFLAKYGSPMTGLGKNFVAAADQHEIDWRLLPAIAFQESNLGKKIPAGSHNPFGWGIYTGKNSGVSFASWEEAIYLVSRGIKRDYISRGFTTPETIAIRYTYNANPQWIFAVKEAMNELSSYFN